MLRILHAAARLRVVLALAAMALGAPTMAEARPETPRYAAMVIDGNTGTVLHEAQADQPRYPASLTKMMTLYLVFEEMKAGRLTNATRITMTPEGAAAQPSKLGLDAGEDLALSDAIKALITKSANDVAIAVAQHIAGSEAAFARRMTERARQLGMASTTFRNASGLPNPEHVTTARDMLALALHLNDDFPGEFKLFSMRSFTYRGKSHRNHNSLMNSFEGMDGIKTGYTSASGFNVVTSVHLKGLHLVGVVFGGATAASRNSQMRFLLRRAIVDASPVHTRTAKPVLVASPALAPRPTRRVTLADGKLPGGGKAEAAPPALPAWQTKTINASAPEPAPARAAEARPAARPAQPAAVPSKAAPPPASRPAIEAKPQTASPAPEPAAEVPAAPATLSGSVDEPPVQIVSVKPVPMGSLVPSPSARRAVDPAAPADKGPETAADEGQRNLDLPRLTTAFTTSAPTPAPRPSTVTVNELPAPVPQPATATSRSARRPEKGKSEGTATTARRPGTLDTQLAMMSDAISGPTKADSRVEPVTLKEPPQPAKGRPPSTLQAQAASLSQGSAAARRDREAAWRVGGPPPAPELAEPPRTPRDYDVEIGVFPSADEADRHLADAKSAAGTLNGYAGLALPVQSEGRLLYQARFTGLRLDSATEACNALRRRSMDCRVVDGQ